MTVGVDAHQSAAPYFHEALVTTSTRDKNLDQLYEIAESVSRLFNASNTGHLTRDTVVDLIFGGRPDLLIGLPEGEWLDVKSQHHDLTTARGKISLAEAVGRFANAEEGGVVVGMDTKRVPGGEIIKSVRPVAINTETSRRYRQAVENRLFPFPASLKFQTIKISAGHGLIVISIPPQEEDLNPSSFTEPSSTAASKARTSASCAVAGRTLFQSPPTDPQHPCRRARTSASRPRTSNSGRAILPSPSDHVAPPPEAHPWHAEHPRGRPDSLSGQVVDRHHMRQKRTVTPSAGDA